MMRLGTRWTSGDEPPASVPATIRPMIAEIDAETPDDPRGRPRWTLTWLEGRPIAELETGMIATLDRGGDPVRRHADDDDLDDEFA